MLGNAIPGEQAPMSICSYDEPRDVPEMEGGHLEDSWVFQGSSASTSVSLLNNNSSSSFPRGCCRSVS